MWKSIEQVTLGLNSELDGARRPAPTRERFAHRCVVPWSLPGVGRGHIGARALPGQARLHKGRLLPPSQPCALIRAQRPFLSLVGPENTKSWARLTVKVRVEWGLWA